MWLEVKVYALYGVHLDGDVEITWTSDNEEEEDEEEEDEEEDHEKEEEEDHENKDEDEDEDEDDGKEPWTTGQGEMVNTSTDEDETMEDDLPMLQPEQGQETCEHTPQPHPTAPASPPSTPDHRQQPRTLETDPLSALEILWPVTPRTPRTAVPTLCGAVAARNSVDVDVDQQLGGELTGDNSLPSVPLPNITVLEARPGYKVGGE
jgi:hypothetical protein